MKEMVRDGFPLCSISTIPAFHRQQVYHGGGVIGIGSHQYIHNTPADYKWVVLKFITFFSFFQKMNSDNY